MSIEHEGRYKGEEEARAAAQSDELADRREDELVNEQSINSIIRELDSELNEAASTLRGEQNVIRETLLQYLREARHTLPEEYVNQVNRIEQEVESTISQLKSLEDNLEQMRNEGIFVDYGNHAQEVNTELDNAHWRDARPKRESEVEE